MREVKSGDIILRIRASSLSIFLFKQEFKTDILKVMSKLFGDMAGTDLSDETKALAALPDGLEFLQILYTLHKTQNQAESLPTPGFEKWIEQYSDLVITDLLQDVLEEAMQGFFRISQSAAPPVQPTAGR